MVAGFESQSELIQRAQAGDEAALEALIVGQQRYVYSVAMGVMKNPTDAADMTQEAFVRVIRALGTYREETKLTTWLYRLVVNVCLDELRRRKRPVDSLDGNGSWDEDEEPAHQRVADRDRWTQPETSLELRESAGDLRRALASIGRAQRLALTLHYFEDLSDAEIAKVMGVPVNTVKSHIHRGKAKLLALLSEEGKGLEREGSREAGTGGRLLRRVTARPLRSLAGSGWGSLGTATRPLAAAKVV
jgi:RNA polymerase sigma-70 factor (ECF subfamily)